AFVPRHPFPVGQLPQPERSGNASASLSRSRQLRTLFEKPRMVHLLKTARSKVPSRRTKSKQYFSPYIRPRWVYPPSRGVVVKAPPGLTPKPAPRNEFLRHWPAANLWSPRP